MTDLQVIRIIVDGFGNRPFSAGDVLFEWKRRYPRSVPPKRKIVSMLRDFNEYTASRDGKNTNFVYRRDGNGC